MKKLLLIATGGTIASSDCGEGLAPTIDADKIMSYIPEASKLCSLSGVSIMSIDSTNMNPERMAIIANTIYENYNDYDGFVITHGTDTMAYSSAALTYMLQNLTKPVILTGSQIALEEDGTDALNNLSCAVRFACEDIAGVYIAFDNILICGTHAMKMKTLSFDAFKSINYPVIASIKNNTVIYNKELSDNELNSLLHREYKEELCLKAKMCDDVFVLKLFPGINPEIFDFIKTNYKGVIIESFGIGGIPNEHHNITQKVGELINAGICVVVTTQCLFEGIDLSIYAVGQTLAKQNVISGGNMPVEALTMKLMWALANIDNANNIKEFIENDNN
jgi:L-asparaginase